MKRKGIILAGGNGTRLYPATIVMSKQLLPVFDKPMIYYPLSILMMAEVREILLISTRQDVERFRGLLKNGNQWGVEINYAIQESPDGIAQALLIGEEFLEGCPSILILGDNIFYGSSLKEKLLSACRCENGATIFTYRVSDPESYGVAEFDSNGKIRRLVEKPKKPRSSLAITGLYFYDKYASKYVRELKPSRRGELEITDLNNYYLALEQLTAERLERGYAWLDAGTHEGLLDANQFVQVTQKRQDIKIACLEEIAFRQNWIDKTQLKALAHPLLNSGYGEYLLQVARESENESY